MEAETGTWHCRKVKDTDNGCELPAQAHCAPGAVAQSAPKDQSAVPLLHSHGTEGPVLLRTFMERDTLKLWSSRIKHEILGVGGKKNFSKAKQGGECNTPGPYLCSCHDKMVWSWERTLFLSSPIPFSSSRLLHRMPPLALLRGTVGHMGLNALLSPGGSPVFTYVVKFSI